MKMIFNTNLSLLQIRAFVPRLILYQIFVCSVQMRVFVPGGEDRPPTRSVRPHLYRVGLAPLQICHPHICTGEEKARYKCESIYTGTNLTPVQISTPPSPPVCLSPPHKYLYVVVHIHTPPVSLSFSSRLVPLSSLSRWGSDDVVGLGRVRQAWRGRARRGRRGGAGGCGWVRQERRRRQASTAWVGEEGQCGAGKGLAGRTIVSVSEVLFFL